MTGPDHRPSVSVVIPSLGRDDSLRATVEDLAKQDYPSWECLIVLQGDVKAENASSLYGVLGNRLRAFHTAEPNASLARNIGLLEATGEVVLFLDDDVQIARADFLHAHARHYVNPEVHAVAGQVLGPGMAPRQRRHWISRLKTCGWLFFPTNYAFRARIASGPSSNLSVRRSSAIAVGGMDAQFEKGAHREESDFGLRLVRRFGLCHFDPEASLVHLGEPMGGCRSWGHNSGIHPLHHVCGEWYFTLRALKLGTMPRATLPFYLYALARRQIFNSINLRSPRRIFEACRRSFEGLKLASQKMAAGPKLLEMLDHSIYTEQQNTKHARSCPFDTPRAPEPSVTAAP
jgi:glycosyltransferase involved in cell wall biosynthesis